MTCVIPLFAPEHRIKSVTIFKSTNLAEIVRTFEIDLKPGQTKIEITGLSSALHSESVRVTGLGSGSGNPLRLYDVVCTVASKDTPAVGHSSSYASIDTQTLLANIPTSLGSAELIRLLKSHLATLQSKKGVREHEANFLVSYGTTLTGEHISPEKMGSFLSMFTERSQKNLVARSELDETTIQVQRRIAIEEQQMEKKKGNTRGVVDIVVGNGEKDNGEDRKVELKLTYIVSNATWEPTYELHARTSSSTGQPSSQVTLHYRASITQSTGEDWTDSALILSSGSSFHRFGQALRMPTIKPIKIRPNMPGSILGPNAAFGKPASLSGQPQATNMFGQPAQANGPSVSTFGGGSTTQTFGLSRQQPQQAGGGIFGSSFGAPQQQLQQTSLSQQQQQQSQHASGGPSGSGLFGAQQRQQAIPQSEGLYDDFEEVHISSAASDPGPGDVPLSQSHTVVTETPVAISYSVEGQVTIPSDGVKHQVGVAVLIFGSEIKENGKRAGDEDVRIEYGVIPRIDTRVYLDCRVKNTSEYRLLPGSVSVILDDTYIAHTNIGLVNPKDSFTYTLGPDPTTTVTYTRSSRSIQSSAGSFAESYKTTTHTTTITLSNRHNFDLKEVRIRDGVPMWDASESEKNRVSVVLKKPEGLADARDGQAVTVKGVDGKERSNVKVYWQKEKAGLFYWKIDVPAGKKETLVLEWEVKAPVGYSLVESYEN